MKAITLPAPIAALTHTRREWREEERLAAGADIDSSAPMVVEWVTAATPPPGDPPWNTANGEEPQ